MRGKAISVSRTPGFRVKRNAQTAGTTRKLKTSSTPPSGTEKVMTEPKIV